MGLDLEILMYDPTDFLLSSRLPAWVKYQTLINIVGKPLNDPEVLHWRKKRDESAIVAGIRSKQAPDGSFPGLPWMHIHKYYFHRMLEMGYDINDKTVSRTAANLLDYQLPEGGYMHPCGRRVNTPDPRIGWGACVTGYVTHALMYLGFRNDHRVINALNVMLAKQRMNGGWICNTSGPYSPYCIYSGTPWVFRCLAEAGLIDSNSQIARQTLELFSKHKQKIIRHGYQKDRFYRCDEALLLPALSAIGISEQHHLNRDLRQSLIDKQQPNGSWLFVGKTSSWYTIEAVTALCKN